MLDKIKEIIDSNNKTVYALLITIFIIILFSVVLIVFIWRGTFESKSKDNPEVVNFETGKYKRLNVSTKDVITKYSQKVANLLKGGKNKELYDLVAKEFLDFKGMDENEFYSYLENKKIYMEDIKIGKYIFSNHNRLGKVFEVEFLNAAETITEKIIFIEKSPNNFTISFDSFIGIDRENRKIIKDGVQFKVKLIEEFVSEVRIIGEFENLTGGKLTINKSHYLEPLYLKFSNNNEVISEASMFLAKTKEIGVNDKFSPTMIFRVDRLSSGSMKSIVLKDVYSDITKEHNNIEFSLE